MNLEFNIRMDRSNGFISLFYIHNNDGTCDSHSSLEYIESKHNIEKYFDFL